MIYTDTNTWGLTVSPECIYIQKLGESQNVSKIYGIRRLQKIANQRYGEYLYKKQKMAGHKVGIIECMR
jgi:hypothetical protein